MDSEVSAQNTSPFQVCLTQINLGHGHTEPTSQNQAAFSLQVGDVPLSIPVTDTAPGESESLLGHVTWPRPVVTVLDQWVPYMRSYRNPLFLSSTIVAILAILIQSASETALPLSGNRLKRPGWAQHRNEGWQYLQGL